MQHLDLLKMPFPAWYLFLQTLPQKFWAQYMGNNNTDLIVQKKLFTVKIRWAIKLHAIYIYTHTYIYMYIMYIIYIYIYIYIYI